jgi:hypothetical protein
MKSRGLFRGGLLASASDAGSRRALTRRAIPTEFDRPPNELTPPTPHANALALGIGMGDHPPELSPSPGGGATPAAPGVAHATPSPQGLGIASTSCTRSRPAGAHPHRRFKVEMPARCEAAALPRALEVHFVTLLRTLKFLASRLLRALPAVPFARGSRLQATAAGHRSDPSQATAAGHRSDPSHPCRGLELYAGRQAIPHLTRAKPSHESGSARTSPRAGEGGGGGAVASATAAWAARAPAAGCSARAPAGGSRRRSGSRRSPSPGSAGAARRPPAGEAP